MFPTRTGVIGGFEGSETVVHYWVSMPDIEW